MRENITKSFTFCSFKSSKISYIKMIKSTEYFFPFKHFPFVVPLWCNNNTVIDGQLNAFKTTSLADVI